MLTFCGLDYCIMDGNGRIRLNTRFIDAFLAQAGGAFAMHCLPEGALALYPESTFQSIFRPEPAMLANAAESFRARRMLRRIGGRTREDVLTKQGRVSVPPAFREFAALTPGKEICVVGVEIGVELWNVERYEAEQAAITAHELERGRLEMASDLQSFELNKGEEK